MGRLREEEARVSFPASQMVQEVFMLEILFVLLQVILKLIVETWIPKHPSSFGYFWVLCSLGLSSPLPRAPQ